MIIASVLIKKGSSLNVCPTMTLERIGIEETSICPNGVMVRAFNGTKTVLLGEIDVRVLIRPCDFEIPFVVVNIPTVFTLLLD